MFEAVAQAATFITSSAAGLKKSNRQVKSETNENVSVHLPAR